jgi:hypothetical protein
MEKYNSLHQQTYLILAYQKYLVQSYIWLEGILHKN